MDYTIRFAEKKDVSAILGLIQELAVFEKEPDAVIVTEADLLENGFGKQPLFTCFVAEKDNIIVAIALVYIRFSTWKGKTVHLEDLIVSNDYRGEGLGTLLLDEVIKYGYSLGVKRICWEVLDWNEPAIKFYESKGATLLKDWYLVQMDETSIKKYIENL
ncbi:GNAT family N-acetyltransferase [Psychroserpens sp. NJDZ02]|uniref:GNAT family N-acetyltransferase n=1 Tax=Psychroserpens sp. NJDZ02 TaxID=2570561 RepID=UPI0010A87EEA|nr:GNAT family N-acetyltransferase [Psychroserpens sp. NJDZ02]QCE40845.1 GNAT family N-acetyltransferase [Psychroserpens sp. NJDZ02]